MRILTANIALGLGNMDHIINGLRGATAYHNWASVLAMFFPPSRGRFGGPAHSVKRLSYLQNHEYLDATFNLIQETSPDHLILNEVIPEIHGSKFEKQLKAMGFVTITYGLGVKYPDAHLSTLVATKEKASVVPVSMPQLPYPGFGGGIAILRLERDLSLVGAHMALGGSVLWDRQLNAIVAAIKTEREIGNKVIFAGDCNQTEKFINPSFSKLELVSVDKDNTSTCPTSLPRIFQWSLDHIYVPYDWKINSFRAIPFGSDHLAISVEVLPSSDHSR